MMSTRTRACGLGLSMSDGCIMAGICGGPRFGPFCLCYAATGYQLSRIGTGFWGVISGRSGACWVLRSALELSKQDGPKENMKYPAVKRMVTVARPAFWVYGVTTPAMADSLDLMGTYIGVVLSWDMGTRCSNLTLTKGNKQDNHTLLTGDLYFKVGVCEGWTEECRLRGEELVDFLRPNPLRRVKHVIEMQVRLHGSKTGPLKNPIVIARRSKDEAQFLEDLCWWIFHSGTRNSDPLLTRYGLKETGDHIADRRCITRKDLNDAAKRCAALTGISPACAKFFTLKSFRIGFNVALKHAGIEQLKILSPEEVERRMRDQAMARAGWSNSTPGIETWMWLTDTTR